uniref:bifunctional [glutamate--ammonia ligase]-adenylyl-L-tyrosine phosphorylase/[glutamate--ammonia-ligase] adenylyltransferase n=1 Tax=Ningiella ruwaisensis TaxID=2364274 RepID=UPI0010A040BF|nr:bifunctional [glutamate--ammonia ligase]-adenylyl-L-tyrosine phosphorylase/[glutamate--ammonia-ligase] adenylyltransferase [Ningiella ruwaisensis]
MPDINNAKDSIRKALSYSEFVSRVNEQQSDALLDAFVDLGSYIDTYASNDEASRADHIGNFYREKLQSALNEIAVDVKNESKLMAALRKFRHAEMAAIACYDLLNEQSIEDSMIEVSALADTIINSAYFWLHQAFIEKYGSPIYEKSSQSPQHLQILAMGKLGGKELNFSSDIDLIFTYPFAGETQGSKRALSHQQLFTKLAQKLIHCLDTITEHGRCFRVDMRLRPMGESGPLVMPHAAFESYYQEQGRAWERYAMQKMRIINADPENNAQAKALRDIIHPFTYRRYLDFTTIDAIREMKRLIENEVKRRQLNDNIKLGKGGIREVEFFVQALQLIHAGRTVECQTSSTLKGLLALKEQEFVPNATYSQMREDYLYLRRIEHFLQMFNDEQTQTLPCDSSKQKRLAELVGLESYQQLTECIFASMSRIHDVFNSVIEDANERSSPHHDSSHHSKDVKNQSDAKEIFDDVWELEMDKAEIDALLLPLVKDLTNPDAVEKQSSELAQQIIDFQHKVKVSGLSERGIRSVNKLMPLLLSELLIDTNPTEKDSLKQHYLDNKVRGVFNILQTITGRVTYLDLLRENPDVRQRLYKLCEKSYWVAQQIALHPILLDELLHPVYLQTDESNLEDYRTQCMDELNQLLLRVLPDDVEQIMDTLRLFKHTFQLRIAAADIVGTIAINQVSDRLSILAEVILEKVVNLAWRETTEKYGSPCNCDAENTGLGIIAYGKFGGIELSYGSDLDVVFLFDSEREGSTDESGTRKALSHLAFYTKLIQRITFYCVTKTYNGQLYDIDLRLRPSGDSGLLISHIDSFAEYQQKSAWVWEHQALVRARCVYGSKSLRQAFISVRHQILSITRDAESLLEDVHKMRLKMREHLNKSTQSDIDIKQCEGGIVDIEFMVQFWILNHTCKHPRLSTWSDNLRILDDLASEHIIDAHLAEELKRSYLWLRHLGHRIQLSGRELATPSSNLSQVLAKVKTAYDGLFSQVVGNSI